MQTMSIVHTTKLEAIPLAYISFIVEVVFFQAPTHIICPLRLWQRHMHYFKTKIAKYLPSLTPCGVFLMTSHFTRAKYLSVQCGCKFTNQFLGSPICALKKSVNMNLGYDRHQSYPSVAIV